MGLGCRFKRLSESLGDYFHWDARFVCECQPYPHLRQNIFRQLQIPQQIINERAQLMSLADDFRRRLLNDFRLV